MWQYKKRINFLGRCNVSVTRLHYTEKVLRMLWLRANRKYRYRTAVHCSAANAFSPSNSVSKLDMDYAVFKEACTSRKLIMKLLIKSLTGEKYTNIGISIGTGGNHCGYRSYINWFVLCPQANTYQIMPQRSSNSRDTFIPEWPSPLITRSFSKTQSCKWILWK